MKKFNFGFTLAEVMITLSIIGIVALIVVPNFIDSSSKNLNIAAARKAEYEVTQAALKSQAECYRWRCTNANPVTLISNYLRNTDEIQYVLSAYDAANDKVTVHVNVDGDTTWDLIYNINSTATVTPIQTCTLAIYEAATGSKCQFSTSSVDAK